MVLFDDKPSFNCARSAKQRYRLIEKHHQIRTTLCKYNLCCHMEIKIKETGKCITDKFKSFYWKKRLQILIKHGVSPQTQPEKMN